MNMAKNIENSKKYIEYCSLRTKELIYYQNSSVFAGFWISIFCHYLRDFNSDSCTMITKKLDTIGEESNLNRTFKVMQIFKSVQGFHLSFSLSLCVFWTGNCRCLVTLRPCTTARENVILAHISTEEIILRINLCVKDSSLCMPLKRYPSTSSCLVRLINWICGMYNKSTDFLYLHW